ncbi:histone-like nucleoid-structuring protein Lsr2 [Streptomyces sp. NPDC054796]
MAQKVITIVTDDLTGKESEDAQTHTFAVNGVVYEIDLASDSYDKFMDVLQPFIKAGRKQKRGRGTTATASKRTVPSQDTAKIREWAREQGYEVNERGRIPANIQDAYAQAH